MKSSIVFLFAITALSSARAYAAEPPATIEALATVDHLQKDELICTIKKVISWSDQADVPDENQMIAVVLTKPNPDLADGDSIAGTFARSGALKTDDGHTLRKYILVTAVKPQAFWLKALGH